MALGPIWIASIVMAAIAALVGIALLRIYVKNFRQARTKFTTGLVIFAAALIIENACTTYIYYDLALTFTAVLAIPLAVLKAMELTGFAVLLWVTVRT